MSEVILGIDLGTTNSVVSIIAEGQPKALRDERGVAILPSVVGFDSEGKLLVGDLARNQALLAPHRTVKSIKRKMGQDIRVQLGDNSYSPQEISAMILRTLKERAERTLGHAVSKAVITVPAFFGENQREATREAGELAGLEVVRIINEPTAAALVYEPHSSSHERLLVYDLGGGTFDVSIVQVEQGVVEVLASHGDTQLGGDDFDQLLLDYLCGIFQEEHGIDLRQIPTARSRMLQAAEEAKKRLSFDAYTEVAEEFIAEKDGRPLNLRIEIDRPQYEMMIEPLLQKTIRCVDAALHDAHLTAAQIDRVLLVGGSTRTPLVHRLLREQLNHEPHLEIDPDLCVSLGAAVQGGLISGIDVGPVLVDITPHTLGIRCMGQLYGVTSDRVFSPIIARNTPLPATRSEIYYTCVEGQSQARIEVFQGENPDATLNTPIGGFTLEGLDEDAAPGNEVLVRFDLNLDGILTVTAVERETRLEERLTIDNAITRFRAKSHQEAKEKLSQLFGVASPAAARPERASVPGANAPAGTSSEDVALSSDAADLLDKARRLLPQAPAEDAEEMRELIDELEQALRASDSPRARQLRDQLEDLVFYLEDA